MAKVKIALMINRLPLQPQYSDFQIPISLDIPLSHPAGRRTTRRSFLQKEGMKMKNGRLMILKCILLTVTMLVSGLAEAADAKKTSFYKSRTLFTMRPGETVSKQIIKYFGPVGMEIELYQPAFVMKAGKIEEGSPAAAAGLRAGMIIESINGRNSRISIRAFSLVASLRRPRRKTA